MNFDQEIQIGFSRTPKGLGNISIDECEIESAAGYAGSYHVLKMGEHYIEYGKSDTTFPLFSELSDFPKYNSFKQLKNKSRASGITGNIGEILSGIIASNTLKFGTAGTAHLKVIGNNRTPDYLLRTTNEFSDFVRTNSSLTTEITKFPKWWLLESKAITEGYIKSNLEDAFRQIALFWYRMRKEYPEGVGYGITIGTILLKGCASIRIFVPKDRAKLIDFYKNFVEEKDYRKDLDDNIENTTKWLI